MEQEFIAGRKKFRMREYNLLRRKAEKRQSITFEQILSGEDGVMNGMPEFIQTAYTTMLKSSNKQGIVGFDERLENVAIEFWPTEKSRSRFFSIVMSATLANFQMKRQGSGDDPEILLTFKAIFPAVLEVNAWAFDHSKADFWAEFEPQQGELELAGEAASEDAPKED